MDRDGHSGSMLRQTLGGKGISLCELSQGRSHSFKPRTELFYCLVYSVRNDRTEADIALHDFGDRAGELLPGEDLDHRLDLTSSREFERLIQVRQTVDGVEFRPSTAASRPSDISGSR
jgi:hypothetical protein